MPQIEEIKQILSGKSEFTDVAYSTVNNCSCIEIPKEKIKEFCSLLKNDLGYDQMIDLVGVDRFTKENRFELIYNLWSNAGKSRIFIRTKLDSKKPEIESVTSFWSGANWLEREEYDMFGIIFLNHPDLRRIYMMEEFEYYPLRKDYPLMGIPGAIELPKK